MGDGRSFPNRFNSWPLGVIFKAKQMGRVKQRWLELEAKHLSDIPDKHFCAKHFADKNIINFIKRNYKDGYCE